MTPNTADRSHRRRLLAYACLALLVVTTRAAYLVHDQTYRQLSGGEMERAASSLARDGTIADVFSSDSGPSAHVPPLYAMFLGGLYAIFGWNTMGGRLAQEACAIATTTLSLLLLPTVARRSGLSERAGWLGALVVALLPVNLWVESSGSWEQPYAALACLALLLAFCRLRSEEWRSRTTVALTGGLVGLSALLSPALLPAAAFAITAEVITGAGRRRRVIEGAALIAAIVALAAAPWAIRNYFALGGFIPFRSNLGLELAIGNNATADGRTYTKSATGETVRPVHPFTDQRESTRLAELGERAYMADKLTEAKSWIQKNPGRAAKLIWARFVLFWFPPSDMWEASSPGRPVKAAASSIIGIAALAELVRLAVARHRHVLLLASAALGPTVIYMVTHVDPRYRYPVFGLTTMLACSFVLSAAKRHRLQR